MPSLLQEQPSSTRRSQIQSPLYSTMASHRDLAPMIDDFVTELPTRVNKILHFAETCNWTQLAMQAQQMKSLAGTYGFFELTETARRLESAAGHAYAVRTLSNALDRLVCVSGRCISGVPS